MNVLPKVNIFLTFILLIGLLLLFLQNIKVAQNEQFNSTRLDSLEKRPIVTNGVVDIPQAGESGKLDLSSVTSYIDQKIAGLENNQATASTSPAATPKAVVTSSKKVTYLPIFGSGFATTSTGWVDVVGSSFQLNINEYGSGSYATWDSHIWVQGGSGEVQVRIFDQTNGVVVQGSEVHGTSSSSSLVTSGKLNFFSGNNTYKIQIQSKTNSTVEFDGGSVKIVY